MESKSGIDWSKILTKIKDAQAQQGGYENNDDRFWSIKLTKEGTFLGYVRLLPAITGDNDDIPFVSYKQHWFYHNKRIFKENCPRSSQQDCPVCKDIYDLYNTNRKLYDDRKAKNNYACNVYIIDDQTTPENNGKVLLWRFGYTIYQKIMEKLTPPDNDREGPCMVFDTLEGADFKINIKGKEVTDEKGQKKIQPDYALCSFISAKPFMDGDKTKVDAILEKRYKMDDIKKTKTYDEILLKYEKVRGDVVGPVKEESYPSPHFMQTEKSAAPASTPAATQPAPATAPAAETPKVEVTPKVEEKKPINLNLEDDEDAFLANLRKKRNG